MAVSDWELIELFKKGKEEAFEEIVRRYQKKVYNTTYRIMGNPEDASDLAQEAFIRIYRSLRNFQGKSSFSTWLFTVTTNVCRDELRKRQRRLKVQSLSEPLEFEDGNVEREIADESMAPEVISLHRELTDEIQAVIETLPDEQKEAIVLRELQGFSYEEIAEITGVSLGTVKSRISRGRQNMKKELSVLVASIS